MYFIQRFFILNLTNCTYTAMLVCSLSNFLINEHDDDH